MLGSLSGGGGAPAGSSLLSSLLGTKLGAVGDFISGHCGIKSGAATSLLGMAAPVLLGTIGKHVTTQGLGASGLGQLLSAQTQYLKDTLPSGLANTLGIGNLLRAPETATYQTAAPASYAERAPAYAGQSAGRSLFKWAWVPIVIALGGWLAWHNAHKTPPAVGGTASNYGGTEVQRSSEIQMPDLQNLNLKPGSLADNLAKAATSGDFSRTFSFQELHIDSAGNLAESDHNQIQELASVLKAAPALKIKIIGYGQTEDAGLSQANAIKSALSSAGVSSDRITTSGETGSQVPALSVVQ